jgi:site-specific DNA-methyltransferase (adenine-specific)
LEFNRLCSGDGLALFPRIATGSNDLVFGDPSFNIGYDYDIYDDRRQTEADLD